MTLSKPKPFKPNISQVTAKQRYLRRLKEIELRVDVSKLSLEEVIEMTGMQRAKNWLQDEAFAVWFFDKDGHIDKLQAYADAAVEKMYDIMNGELEAKVLTARDQLMAAKELATLADRYPNKRKEIVYLDKEVGEMDDEKLIAETEKYKKLLLDDESS